MAYAPVLETLAPVVGGTPDEVERYRKLAEALLAQSSDTRPIGHWTQGLAKMADALVGGLAERKANKIQREGEARGWEYLEGLESQGGGYGGGEYAGGTSGGETADVPGAEPVAATGEVASRLMADLQRDFQLGPEQAAGVVGNLAHESGGFSTMQERNPVVPGSRGGYGYAQWTGPRRKAFERFAAGNQLDPASYEANYGFLKHELANTPEGKVMGALRLAPNATAAADLFSQQFLRPGIPHNDRRRALAQRYAGETADVPGAEPVSTAPSPEVMAHITGSGATPAGMALYPTPHPPVAEQMAEQRAMRPPPVPTPPPPPASSPLPPIAPPPPVARVPQPRPEPPVAPAAPATTGTVAAPAPARPVYAPPVKNDYNALPGRPPAAMPMKPGQLMQEPYSGPMSAQEFARQGQAAMRARKAGLTPGSQPPPGGMAQPPQPRRNFLQALLGRGGPQGQAGAPAAPVAPGAPAGGTRERINAALRDIAFLPPAAQAMALKRLFPEPGEGFTLGPNEIRYGPGGQKIAEGPAGPPEKLPELQRNYERAVEQGYQGSLMDYQLALKSGNTVNIENFGTIPAGYELVTDPATGAKSMRPVPGGPAAIEAQEKVAAAEAGQAGRERTTDIVVEDIDRALDLIGKSPAWTTGVGGKLLENVPGTPARDVAALIDTVKANVGFDKLQAMREASPTGGALGAVTENELRLLHSTIGNLEQSQTTGQLQINLKRVQDTYLDIVHGKGNRPLPKGVTEEDVQHTMEKHGLTREQVLERLR